jgi:ligand-binding sensor domain-containing protein
MPSQAIRIATYFIVATLLAVSFPPCQVARGQKTPVPIGKTATSLGKKITFIFQDSNDHYWFGGGANGVYKYDGERLVLFSMRDGLCSHSVLGIQEDSFGNIYFDTLQGVSKFDGERITTLKVVEHQASDDGWKLEPSDLWFRLGWDKNGPYRYDGQFLHKLRFPDIQRAAEFHSRFPNANWSPYGIYTVYRDRKGAMWFGTAALGVCRYDGKSVSWLYERQLTETPIGGDFGIRSIIEDKDGHFWFCNSRFRYEILPEVSGKTGAQLNYRKKKGVGHSNDDGEMKFPYFMSIAEDDEGGLWMATYDDGVWKNDGEQLVHYPIKDGDANVLLFSTYKDNHGILWLGTHNAGVFKFNGREFKPFLKHS